MPEGHTIHRLARDLARDFEGKRVRASSPQGRFEGSKIIDGQKLTRAHAHGKHLFLDFGEANGKGEGESRGEGEADARVHVHLGLFGKFRKTRAGEAPRPTIRLRLSTKDATWDLSGPTACELIDQDASRALTKRLGVDPLAAAARPAAAWKKIAKSKRPIGALLLDQSIFAGIGNVYRAELLFLANLHPDTPGNEVPRATFDVLWRSAKQLLRAGVEANRIVTVPKHERASNARREQLYVYKRSTCRRCAGEIAKMTCAARALYYCPTCQKL